MSYPNGDKNRLSSYNSDRLKSRSDQPNVSYPNFQIGGNLDFHNARSMPNGYSDSSQQFHRPVLSGADLNLNNFQTNRRLRPNNFNEIEAQVNDLLRSNKDKNFGNNFRNQTTNFSSGRPSAFDFPNISQRTGSGAARFSSGGAQNNMKYVPVHQWKIAFRGDGYGLHLYDFLAQIAMFQRSENVSNEDMMFSIVYLLSDRAKLWYLSIIIGSLNSWEELVTELKKEFLPPNYDYQLF